MEIPCPFDVPVDVWLSLPLDIQREISSTALPCIPPLPPVTPSSSLVMDFQRDRHLDVIDLRNDNVVKRVRYKRDNCRSNLHILSRVDHLNLVIPCRYPVPTPLIASSQGVDDYVHNCDETSSLSNLTECLFTDDVFPPSVSSIDGQSAKNRNSNQVLSLAPTHSHVPIPIPIVPTCKCPDAPPTKQCTVNKDGPNQGRLFWGCNSKLSTSRCGFFQWVESTYHRPNDLKLEWKRFRASDGFVMCGKSGFRADDVRQGGVGDCWFLSGVAVIAEKPELLSRILLNTSLNEQGMYCFRLFIDCKWRIYTIDDYLPVSNRISDKSLLGLSVGLAYSKATDNQLWVPFLEKAYAKAHGSYRAICGGWIAEGLFDLTGAPTETIWFDDIDFDSEDVFVRLLSFIEQGFPMGATCFRSGKGLVNNHAYSILDIKQLDGFIVGQQQKITDFFNNNENGNRKEHVGALPGVSCDGVLRVVKMRNPWGRTEWNGEFGTKSAEWTSRLKSYLGHTDTNDGVFFIPWEKFISHFSSVDVCKCHKNWYTLSFSSMLPAAKYVPRYMYEMKIITATWLYISICQPTKRGKADGKYWFTDLSILIVAIDGNSRVARSIERLHLSGQVKTSHVELLLSDCDVTYIVIPFSLSGMVKYGSDLLAIEDPVKASIDQPFSLRFFSSNPVSIVEANVIGDQFLTMFHIALVSPPTTTLKQLRISNKYIASDIILMVIEGKGAAIALVKNNSVDVDVKVSLFLHAGNLGPSATSCDVTKKPPWKYIMRGHAAIVAVLATSGYCDYENQTVSCVAVDALSIEVVHDVKGCSSLSHTNGNILYENRPLYKSNPVVIDLL